MPGSLLPRPQHQNPRFGGCPWGLRRVCGTCTHFAPDDPAARRADGYCTKRKGLVEGNFSAATCSAWVRVSQVQVRKGSPA